MCLDTAYFVENWKYCSKIIFKCVNSAVEPIFNEKVAEKWSLWDPCTVHCWLGQQLPKKKKKTQA